MFAVSFSAPAMANLPGTNGFAAASETFASKLRAVDEVDGEIRAGLGGCGQREDRQNESKFGKCPVRCLTGTGMPGIFCTSMNETNWYERSRLWREERSIVRSRS